MITYNDLYEALRKERYAEQLQPLPKKFILEVSEYIKEKKQLADKQSDMFSESVVKIKKQLENAISIYKELIVRRRKKILSLAFVAMETGITKKDFENMLDFEKAMFESVIKSMEDSDKKMSELMDGHEKKTTKNKLVVFKENIEEFLGTTGEMLGPFEKGEMSNLPEEVAELLIKAEKAEIVDED